MNYVRQPYIHVKRHLRTLFYLDSVSSLDHCINDLKCQKKIKQDFSIHIVRILVKVCWVAYAIKIMKAL